MTMRDMHTIRHPPSDFLTEVKECRFLPDRMGNKSPHLPHCGSLQKQQAALPGCRKEGLTVKGGGALRQGQGLYSNEGAVW